MLRGLHVLLTMALTSQALSSIPLDPNAQNMCTIEERFNVTVEVLEDYWYEYVVNEWCFSIPPRCSKLKGRWEKRYVPKVVEHTRPIVQCCEGYTPQGSGCKPLCRDPCRHGACALPNICYCFPGFRGPLCQDICKRGFWGGNCAQKCECQNDAYCNPMNGVCVCPPGWRGVRCNDPCQAGYFGYECRRPCFCDGQSCHHVTGECFYPTTTELPTVDPTVDLPTSGEYIDVGFLNDVTTFNKALSLHEISTSQQPSTSAEEFTITVSSTIEDLPTTDEFTSSTEPSTDEFISTTETVSTTIREWITIPDTAFVSLNTTEDLMALESTTRDPMTLQSTTEDLMALQSTTEDLMVLENTTEDPMALQNTTEDPMILMSHNDSTAMTDGFDEHSIAQNMAGLIVTIVFSALGSIMLLIAAAGLAVSRRRKVEPISSDVNTDADIGLYRFYAEEAVPVKNVLLNPTYEMETSRVATDAFNTFRAVDNRFQMELRDILEAEYDHPHSSGRRTPLSYDHVYDELNLPPEATSLSPKYF